MKIFFGIIRKFWLALAAFILIFSLSLFVFLKPNVPIDEAVKVFIKGNHLSSELDMTDSADINAELIDGVSDIFGLENDDNDALIARNLDNENEDDKKENDVNKKEDKKEFIKWVDLNADVNILESVLKHATELDKSGNTQIGFCELMAYVALKNGNSFNYKTDLKNLESIMKAINLGENPLTKYADNKYYKYYVESYHAIFDGVVGKFSKSNSDEVEFGVRGYHPIAKGYWYNDYDDFGNSRSYGYKRKHLGHDLMGGTGTPIVAVEGGTITELGWNQYGGWRVGIRSHDTKRYYYYAHLRKDRPFASGLEVGSEVKAGQVIGYLGVTGYSSKENKNMSTKPHLHFGLQLIFDESQVKGAKEIWIDVYALTKFLSKHNRAAVTKNPETKEYTSTNLIEVKE